MPLGGVPPPPRPAWALAETDEDGPIVVLGAAERMETEAPAEEPGTEQRARRREVDAAEGAAKRLRVMRNSARRAEAVANAADAAVGDGEFTQGQQLNAIHVRQEDRRRETARKRARGSAGEAELPGSDGQANAAAVALVRRALGAASGAAREWNGRWVRRALGAGGDGCQGDPRGGDRGAPADGAGTVRGTGATGARGGGAAGSRASSAGG